MQLLIVRTTDVQLLTNSGTVKIPVVDAEMPVTTLFWLGPLVLLVLYFAFHLYLQRLWEMLAGLPAVFPDGMPVTQKTYPWLMNDMVRSEFPRLRGAGPPLAFSQEYLFTALAYALAPLTLFPFWARYLCRHEWTVTGWHVAVAGLFVWSSLIFFYLARTTLRRSARVVERWCGPWRGAGALVKTGMALLPVAVGALWALCVWEVSRVAITFGVPRELYNPAADDHRGRPFPDIANKYDPRRWVPRVLEEIGDSPFVNFREADVSVKPDTWTGVKPDTWTGAKPDPARHIPGDSIATVRAGAHLAGADLRYGDLHGAFLVNADLRGTDLRCADLQTADLRGAMISPRTDFRAASLDWADLSGDDLIGAALGGGELYGADLTGADLTSADLAGANLKGARLREADLTGADLSGAKLAGADFGGAAFRGTDLEGADLSGATLAGAELTAANFAGANLARTNFAGAYYLEAAPRGVDVKKYGIVHRTPPRAVPGDSRR